MARAWVVAISCGVLLAPGSAHADGASDAAALRQFEDGRAAFDKGRYAEALASFEASLQALPSPNTRLYVARCHRALGHVASAYTNLKRASHEAADRLNATGERRYGATRDAALQEAIELEPRVPHLTIAAPGDAPEATVVALDGAELPRGAWGTALDVDPGPHAVRVTARRRVPFEAKVDLAEGQTRRVDVALARIPTATVALAFKAKPAGLAAEVDGEPVDPAQIEAERELDVGTHRIVVRAPGYAEVVWTQTLRDGERRRVEVDLRLSAGGGSRGTPKWLFFGVAGASAIALGAAAYFAIDATSRAHDEKAKDPLERDPAQQDRIRTESTTANVLFVGGAAIAAGAGVLAFTTDWKGAAPRPTSAARVVPWLGPGGGGLAASGGF